MSSVKVPSPRRRKIGPLPADEAEDPTLRGWTLFTQKTPGKKDRSKWRCPEFRVILKSENPGYEVRRCSVSTRKEFRRNQHIHKFDIPQDDDIDYLIRPYVIAEMNRRQPKSVTEIHEQLLRFLTITVAKLDISAIKGCSEVMREFMISLIQIGIVIANKFPQKMQRPDMFVGVINDHIISDKMTEISHNLLDVSLEKFIDDEFINLIADTGTVLSFKTLHCMILNPYIDKSVLLDTYENNDYDKLQYAKYFSDVVTKAESHGIKVVAIIIDSQPAQFFGASLYVNSQFGIHRAIQVIPCLSHQTNLVFLHAMNDSKILSSFISQVTDFAFFLRSKEYVKELCAKCPLPVKTRWIYIEDTLRYILRYYASIQTLLGIGEAVTNVENELDDEEKYYDEKEYTKKKIPKRDQLRSPTPKEKNNDLLFDIHEKIRKSNKKKLEKRKAQKKNAQHNNQTPELTIAPRMKTNMKQLTLAFKETKKNESPEQPKVSEVVSEKESEEKIEIVNMFTERKLLMTKLSDLFKIILPLKILNLITERHDAKLCTLFPYLQDAIVQFRNLERSIKDEDMRSVLDDVTQHFFAKLKTLKIMPVIITSFLLTFHGNKYLYKLYRTHQDFDRTTYHPKMIPNWFFFSKRFYAFGDDNNFPDTNKENTNKEFTEEQIQQDISKLIPTVASTGNLTNQTDERFDINKETDELLQTDQETSHINKSIANSNPSEVIATTNSTNEDAATNNLEINENKLKDYLDDAEKYIKDDVDLLSYNEELANQKNIDLYRRVHQSVFEMNISLLKIAENFLSNYATLLGMDEDAAEEVTKSFRNWACRNYFKEYSDHRYDSKWVWKLLPMKDPKFTNLGYIARRLLSIGMTEADVERLLSQQKDTMGRHMSNISTQTLFDRLIIKNSDLLPKP